MTSYSFLRFLNKSRGAMVAAILPALFILGCGDSKLLESTAPTVGSPNKPALSAEPSFVPLDSSSPSSNSLRQMKTQCRLAQGCSPSVGTVGAAFSNMIGRCTGFLISSDVVATNAHCIPEDLRRSHAPCRGRVVISLPSMVSGSTTYDYELLECSEILEASDIQDGFRSPDFAFFRVQQVTLRPPLRVNHQGFNNNEDLRILAASHPSDIQMPSEIQEYRCQVARQTFYSLTNHPRINAIEVLAHCPLVQGNSGSPLLAADDSVLGIFHQVVMQDLFPPLMLRALGTVVSSALVRASSFACIATPLDTHFSAPLACGLAATGNQRQEDEVAFGQGQEVARQLIEENSLPWRQGHSHFVQWRVADLIRSMTNGNKGGNGAGLGELLLNATESRNLPVLEPYCVLRSALSSRSTRWAELSLPTWTLRWNLNSLLQSSFAVSAGRPLQVTLSLIQGGAGLVQVTVQGPSYNFEAQLPICPGNE